MGLFSFETFHCETLSFEIPHFETFSLLYFTPPPTRTLGIALCWFAQAARKSAEEAKGLEPAVVIPVVAATEAVNPNRSTLEIGKAGKGSTFNFENLQFEFLKPPSFHF